MLAVKLFQNFQGFKQTGLKIQASARARSTDSTLIGTKYLGFRCLLILFFPKHGIGTLRNTICHSVISRIFFLYNKLKSCIEVTICNLCSCGPHVNEIYWDGDCNANLTFQIYFKFVHCAAEDDLPQRI